MAVTHRGFPAVGMDDILHDWRFTESKTIRLWLFPPAGKIPPTTGGWRPASYCLFHDIPPLMRMRSNPVSILAGNEISYVSRHECGRAGTASQSECIALLLRYARNEPISTRAPGVLLLQ